MFLFVFLFEIMQNLVGNYAFLVGIILLILCQMKIVARKFNAKNCDFEIAVNFLFLKLEGWGKWL